MNPRSCRYRNVRCLRPAATLVWVVIAIPVIFGFAAVGIDLSHLHSTQNDLQRAADTAVLAATTAMGRAEPEDMLGEALLAAQLLADQNPVDGQAVEVSPEDIVLGRASLDADGRYTWDGIGEGRPNAIEMTFRFTVQLTFARVIGQSEQELTATARAVLRPRDIALVCDLSLSMNDDSELRHYQEATINLKAIWEALESPTFGRMAAPTWGSPPQWGEDPWGTDPITAEYDPENDPGLLRMQQRHLLPETAIQHLGEEGQDYEPEEIVRLASPIGDFMSPANYHNRVAAVLGLAHWHSGFEDARFPGPGQGPGDPAWNLIAEDHEMEWVVPYPYEEGSWIDWIDGYIDSTGSKMYETNNDFRGSFGLKTLVNYLLENQSHPDETSDLHETPEQPLYAVKVGASELVGILTELDSGDQLSLETYATTPQHEVDLTPTFAQTYETLLERQSNHYDGATCIGCGLDMARVHLLDEAYFRAGAAKVILLLSDGRADTRDDTPPGEDDEIGGREYAIEQAEIAAANHITIYTIGVGAAVDMDLMEEIAQIGGGGAYHAAGDVEEYSLELQEYMRELGGRRQAILF